MEIAPIQTSAFFLEKPSGNLFCLKFASNPADNIQHGIVFVPPFAEEMNKSRRMYSQLARHLAQAGYSCLLLDLCGTGDSEGDFGDASWDGWIDDVSLAIAKLREQGADKLSLIALRSGALLAGEVIARNSSAVDRLVLWQPVISGETFLTQFFRLKIAAGMADDAGNKTSTKQLFDELKAGRSVEIAGYTVAPSLALPMATKKLGDLIANSSMKIDWFEIVPDESRDIPIVNRKLVEKLVESGVGVNVGKIVGPPFWTATEIVDVPTLWDATCAVLHGVRDGSRP